MGTACQKLATIWVWRPAGLGLAPRRLGIDRTMLHSQRNKSHAYQETTGIRAPPRHRRRYGSAVYPASIELSRAAGSVKRKVAPPPAFDSDQIFPPCASTMVRLIDRPTPMPCGFDVTNGWNSLAAISSDTPGPVSATA